MVTEHGLRPRDVLPVLWQTHEQLNAVLLYVWSVFGVSKGRGPDGTTGIVVQKEIVVQCNMVKEQTQCIIIYDIYYFNIISSSLAYSLYC